MKTFAEMKEFHAGIVSIMEKCTPQFVKGKTPAQILHELKLGLPEYVEKYLSFRPDQRDRLERNYVQWLIKANRWILDDQNPAASYHFIDGHPTFWTFEIDKDAQGGKTYEDSLSSYYGNNEFSFENHALNNVLNTNGFAKDFWKFIGGSNEDPTYMMECGSGIEPLRYSHYHSVDLDTYGKSFDECYVKTAFYVFSLHGISENKESYGEVCDFFWGKEDESDVEASDAITD